MTEGRSEGAAEVLAEEEREHAAQEAVLDESLRLGNALEHAVRQKLRIWDLEAALASLSSSPTEGGPNVVEGLDGSSLYVDNSAAPSPAPEDGRPKLAKGEVMDHDGLVWRVERCEGLSWPAGDNRSDRVYRLLPPIGAALTSTPLRQPTKENDDGN